MIPKDPVMLLSFINLKLRDYYSSFEALCDDLDVDGKEITERLAGINYQYDAEKNRFVQAMLYIRKEVFHCGGLPLLIYRKIASKK